MTPLVFGLALTLGFAAICLNMWISSMIMQLCRQPYRNRLLISTWAITAIFIILITQVAVIR